MADGDARKRAVAKRRKSQMSADLITQARGWIGTPYVHQAACKGAGCDCLGFIRGLWRERFGCEPEAIPAYSHDWAEPQGDEVLHDASARHMRAVATDAPLKAGQVLLFRMKQGAIAKHLGLCSVSQEGPNGPYFIHAYSGHAVTESPLGAPWRRRIAARFVFPQTDPSHGA